MKLDFPCQHKYNSNQKAVRTVCTVQFPDNLFPSIYVRTLLF